jgi:Flp pilus assembly pilin Flp
VTLKRVRFYRHPVRETRYFARLAVPDLWDIIAVWAEKVPARTGNRRMKKIINLIWKLRIWTDNHGQDLIEYALMAGFVAVAAGSIMPGVASSISKIFSKVSSVMSAASTQS